MIEPLSIPGAWLYTPRLFHDSRGTFVEAFKQSTFTDTVGSPLHVAQVNTSVSRRGTVRGIHYADTPPGQAKYVTCAAGSIVDVIVDIRPGSASFGTWTSVRLDAAERKSVFISEGLGHAFVALEDGSVVNYLCSTPYNPTAEHGINPLDPDLAVDWVVPRADLLLSEKDEAAPTLAEALAQGLLPTWADCLATRPIPGS